MASSIQSILPPQSVESGTAQSQDMLAPQGQLRRSSRSAPAPIRLSPEQAKPRTKSYSLNKSKALANKEKTLSRPPLVASMKRGSFVLELQLVMFEAFQQAHRAMVAKKPNYSIQKPASSNRTTLDGHVDTESDQVLINSKKAYIYPFPGYPHPFPYHPYPPPPSPTLSSEVSALREEVNRLSNQLSTEREKVSMLVSQIDDQSILESDRAFLQKTKILELERRLDEEYRKKHNWRHRKPKQEQTRVYEYNHSSPPKHSDRSYRNARSDKRPSPEVREFNSQNVNSDTQEGPTTTAHDEKTGSSDIDPVCTLRGVGTSPRGRSKKETLTKKSSPAKPTPASNPLIQVIPRPRTYSGSSDSSFEDASSEAGSFLEAPRSPNRSK